MMGAVATKRCPCCGEVKLADEFHQYAYTTNQGRRSVRLHSYCKVCDRQTRNRKASAEANRRWRQDNPERVKEQARRAQAKPETKANKAKLQRMRKAAQRAATPYERCEIINTIYALAVAYKQSGVDVHVDHVQPLSRGGLHVWWNLSLLPARENMRKGSKEPTCAMTRSATCLK